MTGSTERGQARYLRAAVAWILDTAICLTIAVVAFVLITGGGAYSIGGVRLGLRSPDNGLAILGLLSVIRFWVRDWGSFLHVRRLSGDALENACRALLQRIDAWTMRLPRSDAVRIVAALCSTALLLKLYFALSAPGFYSGDDVEVHEMTIGHLLNMGWPVWDLRSPIFPFAIVYPAQWIARAAGLDDVPSFVIAGRLMVAALSTITVWIVWRIGRLQHSSSIGYAVLAAAFVASAKLQVAFGSTELPRPVSTVLVCAAFLLLLGSSRRGIAVAGAALGLAATFRFSEAMFLAPAALQLVRTRRRRSDLPLFLLAAGLSAAVLLAISDAVYWSRPFHSLDATVDYTLVQRLSSRGRQPWYWYATNVTQWANPAIAALAIAGASLAPITALWTVLPLVILSVLPHKEARYAIPVIPFVCLLAAHGLRRAIALVERRPRGHWLAPLIVMGVILGTAQDVGHYRLPRSDAAVAMARRLLALRERPSSFAIEQAWRMGGHLYFGAIPVVDLDSALLGDPSYLNGRIDPGAWVVLSRRSSETNSVVRDTLRRRGYRPRLADQRASYVVWSPGG